jgi:dihydroorotate dehydrogenase
MSPGIYSLLWPALRRTPPELAHTLALQALRLPFALAARAPEEPFAWRELRFRNRVGIAAGLDKDARCLRGLERLGAGFVEVGTILTRPWGGNPLRPRMLRLLEQRGIWNRMGFPSDGLERVARRLAAFPRERRGGMVLACNLGPHPLTVRAIGADPARVAEARAELCDLARGLCRHADLFVLNLSSPNTPGLRALLQGDGFARELLRPLCAELLHLRGEAGRELPLLVKLPPEQADGRPWESEALARQVEPWIEAGVAGVVAVNTSTRLARELLPGMEPDLPGGVSGGPLLSLALATVERLRALLPPDHLLVGVGGIGSAADARRMRAAGADLLELYSGLVYAGPGLVGACARELMKRD